MNGERHAPARQLRKLAAHLAIFALAAFAAVQVLHVHSSTQGNPATATHCSVCVVSHSAARPSTPVVQSVVLAVRVVEPGSDPQTKSRLDVEPTFIRPPPASV
jgi:hypothetical protein